MQLVKVKFLKGDIPVGRAYTYITPEPVNVDDLVQINESSRGIVVEVDVPETEVERFKDKLKTIFGKLNEESKIGRLRNVREIQAQDGNWNVDDYMCGLYNGLEMALAILEGREPDLRTIKKEENGGIYNGR